MAEPSWSWTRIRSTCIYGQHATTRSYTIRSSSRTLTATSLRVKQAAAGRSSRWLWYSYGPIVNGRFNVASRQGGPAGAFWGPGIGRTHRLSRICPTAGYGVHLYNENLYLYFSNNMNKVSVLSFCLLQSSRLTRPRILFYLSREIFRDFSLQTLGFPCLCQYSDKKLKYFKSIGSKRRQGRPRDG